MLETFDIQRLEELMNWMKMKRKRTDCVCDELLCDDLLCGCCHSCPFHISDNLVHCFMADEFSNMAE